MPGSLPRGDHRVLGGTRIGRKEPPVQEIGPADIAPRRWRQLETGARPGLWNMACDEAVLAAVEAGTSLPTVRFFEWEPAAVSLGRNQPEPDPGAVAVLTARGVEWVRRPTGGRAVYHGPPSTELTYSVVAPLGTDVLPGGLTDVYRKIHEALAVGLRGLGAEVELAPRRVGAERLRIGPRSRLACFAASAPYEIVAGGRKLLGSAQRRSRHAFLQHGSLPLTGRSSILGEAWPGSLGEGETITLAEAVGRPVAFDEVASALAESLETHLDVTLQSMDLSMEEKARLDLLSRAAASA